VSFLTKLYQWVIIGKDDPNLSDSYERIQLKQVSCIVGSMAFLNIFYSYYFGSLAFSITMIFITLGYAFHILLYHLEYDRLAAYFASFYAVIWSGVCVVLFGQFFGFSATFLATFYIGFVLFRNEKRIRNIILVSNVMLFILVSTYIYYYPALLPMDVPFDQIIVYLGSMAWLLAVSNIYEHQKGSLIGSLKEKNMVLKRTTEELERFTYIASHDLKSPVRNIVSFLGLLEKDIKKLDRADMLEILNYARTGANQMNSLINDILEWSSINSKTGLTERKKIDLDDALSIAINNLQQDIEMKAAQISISDMFDYHCTQSEFTAIFQNIIQNAIKYNESEPPEVAIWAVQQNGSNKIFIKDNGIGIEEEYSEQIFEYFKRLHSAAEYEGTGLGLGLCKKILEGYDGEISVSNNAPELGSTFVISLPRGG